MAKTKKVYRSAISGKFVTKRHTKRSPKTTVTQTVPVKKSRKSK